MTDQSSTPPNAPRSDSKPEKRNLGRGLAALFGEDKPAAAAVVAGPAAAPPEEAVRGARRLPVSQLRPGRMQPRVHFAPAAIEALAQSIRERGVLQPLLVRPVPGEPDQYEIIAGERRWSAAQRAQVHDVPVVVRELDDQAALEIGLVENIQREDLTPMEEARGYRRLIDQFDYTQEALAKLVGKSRPHIANMLRLLTLPEEVRMMVHDGSLGMGHARALLNVADPVALAREIVDKDLSVREAERRAMAGRRASRQGVPRPRAGKGAGKGASKGPAGGAAKDADTLALERDLSMMLGLKVAITLDGEAGDIAIRFETLEQLDDVLHRLKRAPQAGGAE